MIEVIKEGQPKFDVTCEHCDSVLRFQLEDVRRWSDGASGWYGYQITCPVCGKSARIPTNHTSFDYFREHYDKIKSL